MLSLSHGIPINLVLQLGKTLLRSFQHTRQPERITEAIMFLRNALQLLPNDDSTRQRCFEFLCISLIERDGNLDGLPELNPPYEYRQSRPSLETLTRNLGDEALTCFNGELEDLQRRYAVSSRTEDLNLHIQILQHARSSFSSNPGRMSKVLILLARSLKWRFERRNELEDIMEACECCSVGVELLLPDPPNYNFFAIASGVYKRRFEVLGGTKDLELAVHFAKQAMDLMKVHLPNCAHNPAFAASWCVLGNTMVCRYHTTGDAGDLDSAIDAFSRAVDMAKGDRQLPIYLHEFGMALEFRYQRSGRAEDLIEALAVTQEALDYLPPKDRIRMTILTKLSTYELMHSSIKEYGVEQDLNRAFQHVQEAWSIRSEHPDLCNKVQPELINNYVMIIRFWSSTERVKSAAITPETLERIWEVIDIAVELAKGAISAEHHPMSMDLVDSLHFLCNCLFARWELKHALQDLNEAISTARRMVELADSRSGLSNVSVGARTMLGSYLHDRYTNTGVESDREEALKLLLEGRQMSASTPFDRIEVGHEVVNILCEMGDWGSARTLCLELIDIFEILNGRSQEWAEKQRVLNLISNNTSDFAGIALEASGNVLEVIDILERCRGTILGHLIERRSDLHELMEVAPEKAQRFKALQDEISTASHLASDPSMNTNTRAKDTTRRIKAEAELRACLKDIRKVEGFQRFLLGPTEGELKAVAAQGPIVIVNLSRIRDDAIIITKDAFSHLPLKELRHEKLKEYIEGDLTHFDFADFPVKNKKFRELLAWLWEDCVKFIFKRLEDLGYGPTKFRMWWIGTGVASYLPFHAAGKYVGNFSETALSRAISSYTPTLKVLLHSHQTQKNNTLKLEMQSLRGTQRMQKVKPLLTVITMPSTPGKRDLEGVQQEAEEIQNAVGDVFLTQILVQPNAKETMAQMAKSEMVHFASHGESNVPDSSSSRLLLQAITLGSAVPSLDELKVRDVAAIDLSHGKLAFLSACSTAESQNYVVNEVLHLVSGFHVAGYLHVIGNLWSADDETSAKVVKRFYEHLVAAGEFGEGDSVARALNDALMDVAKKKARLPLYWVQFVHFGV